MRARSLLVFLALAALAVASTDAHAPGEDDSHAHFVRQRAGSSRCLFLSPTRPRRRAIRSSISSTAAVRITPPSWRGGVSPDGAQARVHRCHARGGSQLQRARAEAQGRYHDYVANELVDYVDSHYRTIATKEARAIGGLSMGGRIASMTGLTHADRFGAVGAFSPALRPDTEDAVRGAPAAAPFFYISCGTLDSLLPINREFVGWLAERDLPHDYREASGLGHTWVLWDKQIGVFFDLLESRGFRSAS